MTVGDTSNAAGGDASRGSEEPSTDPSGQEAKAPVGILAGTLDRSTFVRRLLITTLCVLLFVLAVYLLEKFRGILQPLFVGLFIGFMILPLHTWLVRRGLWPILSYAVILLLILLGLVGVGTMVYQSADQLRVLLPSYEANAEMMVRGSFERLNLTVPDELKGHFLRELPFLRVRTAEEMVNVVQTALGTFVDFFSWLAVTLVYLVFLTAEKVSFPRRLKLALGERQGGNVLGIVENINRAIGQYVIVKTVVSLAAAALSVIVLAAFGVDLFMFWGALLFLLNYIPYLGSLIAVTLPIAVSFVQFPEQPWKGIVIGILLIAIQQAVGTLLEPRLAGRRLDVSPLLILLSLAFWGAIWGIVGMILAVPLLVIARIILDNIPETKPLATLISNQ